jgi:RNA-directed DNA polymerase
MSSHNTKNSNEGVNMRRVIEPPDPNAYLLERVLSKSNMQQAWKRVKANKGAPGIDNISITEFPDCAREHWNAIRKSLASGSYQPLPVKRVEIPKRSGGTRPLGIPTVTDRLIQQAISQVLGPIFDPGFSDASYGFRPGRSAHDAVYKVRDYIKEGFPSI